jgi:hypothetical protein
MKKTLISLMFVLSSAGLVRAESRVGNGGYGVRIGTTIYALDLAARGVHHDPYLSTGVADRLPAEQQAIVDQQLARITSPEVIGIVSTKLAELQRRIGEAQIRYYDVGRLVRAMGNYRWINVVDLPCQDVGDDDSPFPNKVQLAYRQGDWIRFCSDFNELATADQAAIVFHEIVYGFHTEAQPHVSELTGFVFSRDFQAFTPRDARELIETLTGLTGRAPIIGPPADVTVEVGGILYFDPGVDEVASDVLVSDESELGVRLDPNDPKQMLFTGKLSGRVTVTLKFPHAADKTLIVDVIPESDVVTGVADVSVKVGSTVRFTQSGTDLQEIMVDHPDRLTVRLDANDARVLVLTGRAAGRVKITLFLRDQPQRYVTVDVTQ